MSTRCCELSAPLLYTFPPIRLRYFPPTLEMTQPGTNIVYCFGIRQFHVALFAVFAVFVVFAVLAMFAMFAVLRSLN